MKYRIFIGSSDEDKLAERIYIDSLKKNSSKEIEIIIMDDSIPECPECLKGWKKRNWVTKFTSFRWAVPEMCDFEGLALYTDVDMLNFRDISMIFESDMKGKPLIWTNNHGVILFDCEKCKFFPPIEIMKNVNFNQHRKMIRKFRDCEEMDKRWNCLDGREGEKIEDIWQLHFTNIPTQPWKGKEKHVRPDLVELWKSFI